MMFARIFSYELMFMALLSPLLYTFQGVASSFSDYPLSSFAQNFGDSFNCILGTDPVDDGAYPTEELTCSAVSNISSWLCYVLATVLVGISVNAILEKVSSAVFTRSMILAIAISFLTLLVYDGKKEDVRHSCICTHTHAFSNVRSPINATMHSFTANLCEPRRSLQSLLY